MATWSKIRSKLENEYLAESLRGHIQYYCTSYSKSPDHEGRASIRLDGKELISGCYWNNWFKAAFFPMMGPTKKGCMRNLLIWMKPP